LAYITHTDQMFITAGSLASGCGAAPQPADVWLFNFANNTWTKPNITYVGARPGMGTDHQGYTSVYHPDHRVVYFHDQAYLFRYNPADNTVTQISGLNGITYITNAVLDPVRNLYIIMGHSGSQARVYNLANARTASVGEIDSDNVNVSGGSGIMGDSYLGLAYDPTRDRVVAWSGGNTVYFLNTATWSWTSQSFSGGPASIPQGTNGRWRYSPASNLFAVVNSVDSNAYVLRLTAGGPIEPAVAPAPPTGLQIR
jgi:hypothetical protein